MILRSKRNIMIDLCSHWGYNNKAYNKKNINFSKENDWFNWMNDIGENIQRINSYKTFLYKKITNDLLRFDHSI